MLQRFMVHGSPTLQQQQVPPTHMWIPSSATEGAMANTQNEQRMGPPPDAGPSLSSSGEILIHNSNSSNSNSNNSNNCHADSRNSLSGSNHQPVAHTSSSSPLVSLSAPMRIRPLSFSASVSSHNHLQLSTHSFSSSSSSSSSSLFRAISDSQSTLLWNQNPRPAGLVCQSSSLSPVGGGKSELCVKQPSQSQTPQHLPQRFNRFPNQ